MVSEDSHLKKKSAARQTSAKPSAKETKSKSSTKETLVKPTAKVSPSKSSTKKRGSKSTPVSGSTINLTPKAPAKASAKNIPTKIEPDGLADYLEIMSIAVFQASVSWALILNKLENFRIAFDNFEPSKVSKYDEEKIRALMNDTGILRNEKKIRATIENATTMLRISQEHGNFPNYLHSFTSYELLCKDMKKRFKFFGDLSVYYFLFRVGEPVPDFNEWIESIPGEHPRMREMIEQYK